MGRPKKSCSVYFPAEFSESFLYLVNNQKNQTSGAARLTRSGQQAKKKPPHFVSTIKNGSKNIVFYYYHKASFRLSNCLALFVLTQMTRSNHWNWKRPIASGNISAHVYLDCKTVRIFAYSSTREQSNKRSGTRLKTESETGERR